MNREQKSKRNLSIKETEVKWRGLDVGSEGCKKLSEKLKISNTLISAHLDSNNIGIEGFKYLAEGIMANNSLKILHLNINNAEVAGCQELGKALQSNSSIEELSLNDCKVTDEAFKYFCEALKTNRSLKILSFKSNFIGNIGCKYLSEALKINNSLQKINLKSNIIGDEGCKYLSEALVTNSTLELLKLKENNIGNEGGNHLYEALKINHTLQEIKLFKNKVEDYSIVKQIEEKLKINKEINNKGNKFDIKKNLTINWEEISKKLANFKILSIEECSLKDFKIELDKFKHLIVLDLKNNELNNEFIKSLCKFLKWNPSLKILNLQGNKSIGDREGEELLSVLPFNIYLLQCNLDGTSVSNEIQGKIKATLEGNILFTEINGELSLNQLCSNRTELAELIISNKDSEAKAILNSNIKNIPFLQEALFICCVWNQIELCEFLLNHEDFNLDINYTLDDGNTYLHLSVMKDNYEISKLLVENGINPNLKNKEKKTCKDLCIPNGYCKALFEDIKQLKVVILGKSKVGKTLLVEKLLKSERFEKYLTYDVTKKKINSKKKKAIGIYEWIIFPKANKQESSNSQLNSPKLSFLTKSESAKSDLTKTTNTNNSNPSLRKIHSTSEINPNSHKSKLINNFNSETCVIQLWDFGGEELLYTTHQFFLYKNSINLLVFSMDDGFIEKDILFWLNSIQYRAPKSKVIIVGTFLDTIDPKLMEVEVNLKSNKIKKLYDEVISRNADKSNDIELISCSCWESPKEKPPRKYIQSKIWFYPVSGKEGWNINYLKNVIQNYGIEVLVSKQFTKLAYELSVIRRTRVTFKKNPILLSEELISIVANYFKTDEEIEKTIKLLHELGYILDFGMKYIIIYPQWLSNILQSIIKSKNSDGIVSTKEILKNLSREIRPKRYTAIPMNERHDSAFVYPENISNADFLLSLLEKFQICIPNPEFVDVKLSKSAKQKESNSNSDMIILSLIKRERVKEFETYFNLSYLPSTQSNQSTQTNSPQNVNTVDKEFLGRRYLFPFMPRGIFEHIFGKVSSFLGSDIKFWKNGFYIVANQGKIHFFFELQSSENRETSEPLSPSDKRKKPIENFHKGNLIEIKCTGELSYKLISAFHFCIKDLFERNYPSLWYNVKIELSYSKNDDKFTNYLSNCLEIYKRSKDELVKTMNGVAIPWIKLIPEELETRDNEEPSGGYNQNLDILQVKPSTRYIPISKLTEAKYYEVYICRSLFEAGLFVVKQFKMTQFNESKQPQMMNNFDKELDILTKIHKCPNICPLIGFIQSPSNWLLVFPLFDSSLEDLIKKCNTPSEHTKSPNNSFWIFICKEILTGLDHLHSNYIVHLDIKSSNVLLKFKKGETNEQALTKVNIESVCISDFSTAQRLQNADIKLGKFIGSFYHMAPEIQEFAPKKKREKKEPAANYDPFKADIYSFGVLLCEIASKNSRFDVTTDMDRIKGSPFEKIINKCLEKDPDARPSFNKLLQEIKPME